MPTHRCAFVVRSEPGTRNFTPVSSPWITRDSSNRRCISWFSGVSNSDARNSQSLRVERATVTPDRAELAGEPVDRDVVGELGGDDVGQQAGAAQPLRDRPDLGGAGGLDTLLHRHGCRVAVPAGVTLLDGAEDEEPGRFQVELLGRLLPDACPRPAAARAQLLRLGQVVDDLAAFEVVGQRGAAVRVPPGWRLVGGAHRRRTAFAPATESVLQSRVQFGRQVGVLGPQLGPPRRAGRGPSPGAWRHRSAGGHRETGWRRPCSMEHRTGRRVARHYAGVGENRLNRRTRDRSMPSRIMANWAAVNSIPAAVAAGK